MNKQRIYPSLRHWRDDNRFSQHEAASKLGVSQTYYSRLERGVQYPRRRLAKTISERAGVPLENVLGLA